MIIVEVCPYVLFHTINMSKSKLKNNINFYQYHCTFPRFLAFTIRICALKWVPHSTIYEKHLVIVVICQNKWYKIVFCRVKWQKLATNLKSFEFAEHDGVLLDIFAVWGNFVIISPYRVADDERRLLRPWVRGMGYDLHWNS